MPKLLFVVNESFFFLSHRLAVAREAASRGFEVHVAAPEDHVWAPDDFDVGEISKLGFYFHPVRISRRGMNPIKELHSFWTMFRLVRSVRPDVLHLITVKPNLYGSIVARFLKTPALVLHITGLGQIFIEQSFKMRLIRSGVRFLLRSATRHANVRILVQNAGDLDALSRDEITSRDCYRLIRGSGVPLTEFTCKPQKPGLPVVILAARLIWEKGIGEFVAAARLLRERGIRARFLLIGDTKASNPRSVSLQHLRDWEAEGIIEWKGYQRDMPGILAASHIVCLPTRYGEGVPRILIEAAASGRPIVATQMPGCCEIVRNEENGLLVACNDPIVLADALERLISDAELRDRYGRRGREIAERDFSEIDIARRTADVYAELLHSASPPVEPDDINVSSPHG